MGRNYLAHPDSDAAKAVLVRERILSDLIRANL
jgi:hypothetical protein